MSQPDRPYRLRSEPAPSRLSLGAPPPASAQLAGPWASVEAVMARKIQNATGARDGVEFVASALNRWSSPHFLGVGAGSCSLALDWILPRAKDPAACVLECVDSSRGAIAQCQQHAQTLGISFVGTEVDLGERASPRTPTT